MLDKKNQEDQQADIYVKSKLPDTLGDVKIWREPKKERESGALTEMVVKKFRTKYPMPDTETTLFIKAPPMEKNKRCPIQIESDVDLTFSYSRKESLWKINIHPSGLPNDVPINVNITVGGDEPENPVEDPPEGGQTPPPPPTGGS